MRLIVLPLQSIVLYSRGNKINNLAFQEFVNDERKTISCEHTILAVRRNHTKLGKRIS